MKNTFLPLLVLISSIVKAQPARLSQTNNLLRPLRFKKNLGGLFSYFKSSQSFPSQSNRLFRHQDESWSTPPLGRGVEGVHLHES